MPVFVVGCPRSGTTLMGKWVGSSRSVYGLGEYFGFVHTLQTLPGSFDRLQPSYADEYLARLRDTVAGFAVELAHRNGAEDFCDSTPWNILAVPDLIRLFPGARFVLMLRHFSGVLLSLEGSWQRGYEWAGGTWDARAALWAALNRHVDLLPRERTTVVSYDYLCRRPSDMMQYLAGELDRLKIDTSEADRGVFAESHAGGLPQYTVAMKSTNDGLPSISWRSIPSLDDSEWSAVNLTRETRTLLLDTDRRLRTLFPDVHMYSSPENWSDRLLADERELS